MSFTECIKVHGLDVVLQFNEAEYADTTDFEGVYKTGRRYKRPYEVFIDESSGGYPYKDYPRAEDRYVVDFRELVKGFRERNTGQEAHFCALRHIAYLKARFRGDVNEYCVAAEFEDPMGNRFLSQDSEFMELGEYRVPGECGLIKRIDLDWERSDFKDICEDAIQQAIDDAVKKEHWHLCQWYRNKMGPNKFMEFV